MKPEPNLYPRETPRGTTSHAEVEVYNAFKTHRPKGCDPKPEKRAMDKLSLKRQAWSSIEEDTKMAKKGHSEEQILRALGRDREQPC